MKLLIGEELEDQALGRAIKANRKNDFVSRVNSKSKAFQKLIFFQKDSNK